MIYAHLIASFMPSFLGIVADEGGSQKPDVKTPSDPKAEFRQLASELKNLVSTQADKTKGEYEEGLKKINDRFDKLEFDFEQSAKNRVATPTDTFQHRDAFKKSLLEFAKGNRNALHDNYASGALDIKGGYHPMLMKSDNIVRFDQTSGAALLMPAEMSRQMLYNAIEATPIAQLVDTTTCSSATKTVTIRTGTPGIQWIGEEGETDKGKMTYKVITLTPKKAAARYGMSIEQEQDSQWDPIAECMKAYEEDFRVGVGTAALTGNGVDRPTGMVGKMGGMNTASLALSTDLLIRLQEQILEEYQDNASWLFTRKTRAYIRSLVLSATNGLQYTWEPDFQRKSPTLLLGDPVFIAREGDLAGLVSGNFTAGHVPVLYGDFKSAYELTVRSDMYMIDDPYSESKSFIRNLAIMSRIDGKPTKTEAVVELRITNP